MLEQPPEKFPFIDIKTSSGVRVVVGPCAVRLILRMVSIGLISRTVFLFGPDLRKGTHYSAAGLGHLGEISGTVSILSAAGLYPSSATG